MPLLWAFSHNVIKYANHYWFIDFNIWRYITPTHGIILASSRQNLSSGFPTKRDSNQSHQLERLSKKLKFRHIASLDMLLFNKGITMVLIRLHIRAG